MSETKLKKQSLNSNIINMTECFRNNSAWNTPSSSTNWVDMASGSLTTNGKSIVLLGQISFYRQDYPGMAIVRIKFDNGVTAYYAPDMKVFHNSILDHQEFFYSTVMTTLPAGNYTVKMQVLNTGSGYINRDESDLCNIIAIETT